MNQDGISLKLLAIAVIAGACFVASLLALALVEERRDRLSDARREIASQWGQRQVITGPMVVAETEEETPTRTYILPENTRIEATMLPETRSRGIFDVVVYSSAVKISGEFSAAELARGRSGTAVFSLPITDTRGIEEELTLTWAGANYAFEPGPGAGFQEGSGLHAAVPVDANAGTIPFSLAFQIKGSEGISFTPVGKETIVVMSSPWQSPKFTGTFLPSQRDVNASGFQAEWRLSSFGRSFPQTWRGDEVSAAQLSASTFGVDLYPGVDAYDMIFRSVKYAVLFIIITFAVFFLFDVLARVRVHPIQYLLIGSALALFYILLLSLAEQIGFIAAYITATAMITLLVSLYSAFVLRSKRRAVPIAVMLVALYGYLYFVLQLEDYALLFGSLLLFMLLGGIMYLTRDIDWYALGKKPA
ncbi:cell envelope integrity protein CreD [Candidatus Parcubacteria bacterium]|nr:MAG: cell envelope integrity protein CreD [Candidatus Parcubacteria bacterium]